LAPAPRAADISVKIAPLSADNTGKQHLALKSFTVEETMRRFALFLLALHLAAPAAFAQTPPARPAQAVAPPPEPASPLLQPTAQPAAPAGGLEVRVGERAPTYLAGKDVPPEQPRATPPMREALLTFDPQRADVVWSQNHWQLVVDGQVLKDFGRREVEARVALRVLRDLHLTQHGAIGSPHPVMEYWLSDGRAPHGLTSGLHILQLDPGHLRVEQVQGQWTVRDPNRVLFNFGTQETDARQALAVMQKYGFTEVGTLGSAGGPTMLVMLGRGGEGAGKADPNLPHLPPHQPPLRPSSSNDPNALKSPASKPPLADVSPVVTPVIPALHQEPATRKQSVNAFGHSETVEVLSAGEPSLPKRTPPPLPAREPAAGWQSRGALATEWIDRTQFDWRQFQLRQEGGQQTLQAGNLVLARFSNDHDARQALAAVQHYRFTEQDRIGRPQAYCSYFLCNGQPPRGQFVGVRGEPFQPDKLSVSRVEDRWAIVNGEKPLVWFGDRPEEARVMLDVIQRNQFDRLCHIGDDRGLSFFVRSR
jgi:hypothetical protein